MGDPVGRLRAPQRVRVVVEQADGATCGLGVGDWFEVEGSLMRMPAGGRFCPNALAAVFPVLAMRQGELPADDWLARKPYVCCPLGSEQVVMRLDAHYDDPAGLTGNGAT